MRSYLITIEPPETLGENFSAYCPDILGCVSTGATREETISNMIEALEAHFNLMVESGETIPPAVSESVQVAVHVPTASKAA